MLKIAVLVWIILGATVAGIALTVVLATPSLAQESMKLVPWSVLIGFVVAMPLSWLVARQISALARSR